MIKLFNILVYDYRVAMSCYAHSMCMQLQTSTENAYHCAPSCLCEDRCVCSCISCECGDIMQSIQCRSLVVRGELARISSTLAHLLTYV